MRFMVAVLVLCGSLYASESADLDTLKKQLDSINNSQEAKAILMNGVDLVQKWALVGASSKEARIRIAETAKQLEPYWGEDSTTTLKNRLNGMVSVLNGEVVWSGTPKKFIELKQQLIDDKQAKIDALEEQLANAAKEALPKSNVELMYRVPARGTKELYKTALKIHDIKQNALKKKEGVAEVVNTEILPYLWKLPFCVLSYSAMADRDIAIVFGYIPDKHFYQTKIRLYTTKESVPDTWKQGDVVEIAGFISGQTQDSIYVSLREAPYKMSNDPKIPTTIPNSAEIVGIYVFSPELIDRDGDKLIREGWKPRTILKEE